MAEEKKNQKLTYEQLSQYCGELSQQYQKAIERIRSLESALRDDSFNRMSFFLSMLFKVMDHPEMYESEFVEWASANIQNIMHSFVTEADKAAEESDGTVKDEEKSDEA